MIDKQQTLAIAISTYTSKIPVNDVTFEYSEDYQEYTTLCGPMNTAMVTYDEKTKCTVVADTNMNLDLLYEIGIGSKNVTAGVTTYTPSINNTLIKVLEEFPEQTSEHSNANIRSLNLKYNLEGLATTEVVLEGTTATQVAGTVIPTDTVSSTVIKHFDITLSGYVGNVVDVDILIENVFKRFTCMSGEFLGSTMIGKGTSGSMILDGAIKNLTGHTLSIDSASHGLSAEIYINTLKEKVIDGVVYTEASFLVLDNNLSVYFK